MLFQYIFRMLHLINSGKNRESGEVYFCRIGTNISSVNGSRTAVVRNRVF